VFVVRPSRLSLQQGQAEQQLQLSTTACNAISGE